MHQLKNVGPVELATISFGQSFQLTPIQMASTVSSLINGGERVTPHIALTCRDRDGKVTRTYKTKDKGSVVSKEAASEILRGLLHQVVAEGTGKNGQVAGFAVRRQDGDIADASSRERKVYRFLYRVCPGRGSRGLNHRYYP